MEEYLNFEIFVTIVSIFLTEEFHLKVIFNNLMSHDAFHHFLDLCHQASLDVIPFHTCRRSQVLDR